MELPISAVIFLAKQELAFRGHLEGTSSTNRGNYKELLDFGLSKSPAEIQQHYKKITPVFAGNSKTIQNELINCISEYIDEYVETEVKESKFFSVQVDDSTDIAHKSQCSIVIRYVNIHGNLVERFLGFFDVSSSRTAEALFGVITACLEKFEYKTKLVAQCFDGASVMSGHLNGLQSKIKEVAPQAVFVHCLAHRLNLVLQQGCNSISKCRIFFANLCGIPTFFHHSAKRTHVADAVVGRRMPTSVVTRWTSNSKILSLVNIEWDSLKQVFSDIMDDPTSDQSTVRQSEGFLSKFNDFEFTLLVIIFNEIFELTGVLFDVLQKKSFDINFCVSQITKTQDLLNSRRNEDKFKEIFDLAARRTLVPNEHRDGRQRVTLTEDQVFDRYKILYYEILDTLSLQITTRFKDTEKLCFITLMDTSKFVEYAKKFPDEAFNNLKLCYPFIFTAFEFQRLRTELELIYGDTEYRSMKSHDLMKDLTEKKKIFKQGYKLYCLIVTIPSTSVSVERSFSCLKRIKSYLRNSMTEERLTSLSKISIEKELVNELIETRPFYDDIIDKFASLKDRRIDLVYKR